MTQNLSQAQWDLIKEDLNEILTDTDTYKQLREALRDWIDEYGDLDSGYRVDKDTRTTGFQY